MNHYQIIFDNILLENLLTMVKATKVDSFSGAAKRLNMSTATANQAIERVKRYETCVDPHKYQGAITQ